MKRILFSSILAVTLFAACTSQSSTASATANSSDSTAAVDAINKADSLWNVQSSLNSAEGWLSFYSDDAIMMPPGEKVCVDKASRAVSIKNMFATPGANMRFEATKTEVSKSADMGYSTGIYHFKFKDAAGKNAQETGKFDETWKKQADGSWKCVVDIWNADPAK